MILQVQGVQCADLLGRNCADLASDVHRVRSGVGSQGTQSRGPELSEPVHRALLRPLGVSRPRCVPAGDTGPATGSDVGRSHSFGNEKPPFSQ